MLATKINKIIELSDEIKALFTALHLSSDNSKQLTRAENLLQQRDNDIRAFFTRYSEQEIIQHPEVLEQLITSDRELQQVAGDVKEQMSKYIIQQKRHAKAAKAYKNI